MKKINEIYNNTEAYHAWIFPALCLIIFIVLCVGKVHGSSIGIFKANTNPGVEDKNLLFGNPKSIRSDEWVVISPLQFAQKAANYSMINPNIGFGQDMAVVLDMPIRDWSVIFKPQNIPYLFLPFSIAFSFHWWFMLLALIMGAYLLFKTLIPPPKNNLLSAVLATAFSVSPFIMWWYANGTLLTIAYVFIIITIFIHLINTPKLIHKILLGGAFGYFAVCLALTFYTPFIIATCFAGVFIVLGYLFSQPNPRKFINKKNVLTLLGSLALAGIILATFYIGHKEVISLIQNTVYPGHQTTIDKPVPIKAIFDVFKLFFLQSSDFVVNNDINQSEASNFVYLFIYLIIPAVYMVYEGIKNKKNDWFLILISIGIVLLIVRITGFGNVDSVYKTLYIDRASRPRILIGLGVLNIAFVIAVIRNIKLRSKPLPNLLVVASVAVAGLLVAAQYLVFRSKFEHFVANTKIYVVFIALAIMLIAWLVLYKKTIIYAAICLLLLTSSLSFFVNPIYRGVPFEHDQLVNSISDQNQVETGVWVVVENIALEQYPQMAGAKSISGVMIYPQYDIWKSFPGYDGNKDTINRYAHIMFKINNQNVNTIYLNQPDLYTVNIDPCNDFAQQNITYFVGTKAEDSKCIEPVKIFLNNQQQIFIYKVVKIVI